MHIEFTQADESHVDDLVELINATYRDQSPKQEWTTEGLRTLLNKEDSIILIAEDDDTGDLLGCVHLEKQGTKCHLGLLTVAPEMQSKSLEKMLLAEAEALAQFWDCSIIRI